MAAFYPFLYGDQRQFPEQNPGDFRIAGFVGVVGEDQLVPGPVLDTATIDDIHQVLMLVGLKFEDMRVIRREDGAAARFAWIGFDRILPLNAEIVFALEEPAAREFLLDLRNVAQMLEAIRPNERGGCMIEITLAQAA
jgi:hypothetical protein